jgi:hypothetical protein
MKSSLVSLPRVFGLLVLLCLGSGTALGQTAQAWLLLSYNMSESVLSTDPKEKGVLERAGWKVNGTALLQLKAEPDTAPVHRLARSGPKGTDRRLEADATRLAAQKKSGYNDEGAMGHVSLKAKPGLIPVQHFTRGDYHLWLFDAADQAAAEKLGWKLDGVDFWVWPVAGKTK